MAADGYRRAQVKIAEVGAVMTAAHCDLQIKRLLVLKGIPEDVVEYFAALQDVPDDLFSKAVSHAIRTRHWFPTPAELRADCDAVTGPVFYAPEPEITDLVGGGREVFLKNPFGGGGGITIRLSREWKFYCATCADSGWAPRWCGTQRPTHLDAPIQSCGRRREHDQHEWVDPCDCLSWNPTLQRRRAANAKYAQPPEKV